jgi:hypothetical protein
MGPAAGASSRQGTVNRDEFRRIAILRLKEARALLLGGHFSGAYYLTGYVVECGLKACIAKRTKRHEFPDKKLVEDSYTHDLVKLVKTAGLEPVLAADAAADSDFRDNWTTARAWKEDSRYKTYERQEASNIYLAVAGRKHGVLRWIRQHW